MHQLTGKIDDFGPVVEVAICVTQAREEALRKAGKKVPERIRLLKALLDTGSDCVALDSIHAGILELPFHSIEKLRTVDEIKYPAQFEVGVRLVFDNKELLFEVEGCCFNELKKRNGIDMIIGRNILSAFEFLYDGPKNSFILTCNH